MAVRGSTFNRILEQELAKGKSYADAVEEAKAKSEVKPEDTEKSRQEYKLYRKEIKRLGGKEKATPKQYEEIKKRLKRRYK